MTIFWLDSHSGRPWMARITGRSEKFGLEREFLAPVEKKRGARAPRAALSARGSSWATSMPLTVSTTSRSPMKTSTASDSAVGTSVRRIGCVVRVDGEGGKETCLRSCTPHGRSLGRH